MFASIKSALVKVARSAVETVGENTGDTTTTTTTEETGGSILSTLGDILRENKNVVIAVGAVGAGYAGYKAYQKYFGTEQAADKRVQETAKPAAKPAGEKPAESSKEEAPKA